MKDGFGILVFLIAYVTFVFFMPNALGHPDNYIPANPLVTPPHIVPEWYFLPFYAILRAITFDIGIPFTDIVFIEAKLGGVLAMFGSIALVMLMPWFDTHPVRSARYRPKYKAALLAFVACVLVLGKMGGMPADVPLIKFTDTLAFTTTHVSQLMTLYYFAFFLVVLPYLSRHEKALPMPETIHQSVLEQAAKKPILAEPIPAK
jgi:ubiquinol-cytochrome c reductase cytochrome b subunit